ncbi:hypothetical protein ACFX5D_13960 [Flavobacterium sp. LB3P45]|uniref:Uncharacterized protein n=1 Tax=Flavobacterium fructosi TaxID=3230416 RepID=A0ABW6HQZ2_9FLAO
MADKNTLKNWFKTGLKPTQAQFWALFDSYFHKDEKIPITAIDDIENILADKADAEVLAHHLTDETAHADLFLGKEDKSKRGSALGYAPLNEFSKLASEYLNIVNDLVTGGATALASAETVKTLKTQINSINTILTSNDVNLDNVQELVDAIKTVQTSLSTILVNDLTTGGTTKALTAEMGKILKGLIDSLTTVVGNKVDKVAGERLINAAEITKLAGLGSIATTVKPILSTALASQNVAGMVTYINALTPVLVVGGSEIVKYTTTDTGRVFQLNLRGRSFGVGQPAIVAADVLEVTEFLNKDLKLSNYPNTRNDGQLPTNKVLSTDANGNLKMYTIATAPAPYLEILIPDSTMPSTTTNFTLKGAFFTPAMTVAIAGQTVNYITFKSDNLVLVNVTTGATEGSYAVTLNNGIEAIFNNALLIVLGTVYKPEITDWINITQPIDFASGSVLTKNYGSLGYAQWNKILDRTKNFEIRYKPVISPLGANSSNAMTLQIMRAGDNKRMFYNKSAGPYNDLYVDDVYIISAFDFNQTQFQEVKWRYAGGVWTMYYNGVLKHTHSGAFNSLTSDVYLIFGVQGKNMIDIKYIELV